MPLTRGYMFDKELQLADGAAAITASGVTQVDGSAASLDLGAAANGSGDLVVDVSAIDITTGDESYELLLQGSSNSDFSSDVQTIARGKLGDSSTLGTGVDADSVVGRHVIPFHNDVAQTTSYQYLRLAVVVAGTTPSITLSAFVGMSKVVKA